MKRMKNRNGSIIVLAVIMVVVLLIIGLAMIRLGLNTRLTAIRTTAVMSARTAADAGISKAALLMKTEYVKNPATYIATPTALIAKVTTGSVTPSGTFNETTPTASYSYTVSYNNADKTYQVDSTGTVGDKQRTVHAILAGQNHFFGIGLYKKLDVSNNDNFTATAASNRPFLIKTNSASPGDVYIANNSTITGDVAVGFGADPLSVITPKKGAPEDCISGKIYSSPNYNYPLPVAPVGLPIGPNSVAGNYTITKSCQYNSITAAGDVVIQPNLGPITLYVSGAMNISNIVIGQGTSLSLYIGQNLTGTNNISITNNNLDSGGTPDPTTMVIYGTGGVSSIQNITFKNNADVFCGIYAPNADIQLKNNGNVYGAIVANSFIAKNNLNFYYYSAFNDFNLGISNYYLEITRWWEE